MRVLCYVNHYFGRAVGFEGLAQPRSTTGDDGHRRLIVAACLDALRALPGAEVNVCGIAGNALETIDIDFSQALSDPRMLPFESLAHMARRVDEYDYFINIEDDILVPPETFANVVAFDQESLVNEVLHPNRIEEDETGRVLLRRPQSHPWLDIPAADIPWAGDPRGAEPALGGADPLAR